jgi:hypothetical protein
MQILQKIALLATVGLGAAVLASPAFGARPAPGYTLVTPHFMIHYQTDPATDYPITQTMAGDAAALAEDAYDAELADGYPAPASDGGLGGDNRIDIYVVDSGALGALGEVLPSPSASPPPVVLGEADPDTGNPQTSGYIQLNGSQAEVALGLDQHTIANALFHLIQLGIWQSPAVSDYWLYAGSAEWMAYSVDGYAGDLTVGPDDMALDCRDPAFEWVQCDFDLYKDNGYSRWPFFEYLAEKYGASFVKDIFAQGAAGAPSAIAAVADALAAKGTTLADTYNAWTTAQLTSGYSISALQALKPSAYQAAIETGSTDKWSTTTEVPVNHLSTRYLEFQRGGDDSTACFVATLTLTVTMPAGTLSKPTFYWDEPGNPAVALSINGNTASAPIPWDTCTWAANEGFLSLPNASTNVDAARFEVKASLSVNTSLLATPPSIPPPPISVWGPVVPVTSAEVPPTVTVYGPELLKLAATNAQIRLIVESNGEGSLQASLGSVALGAGALRPGSNDLRFTVPAALLNSLRRSSAVANVLTLTPVSADGVSKGTPVTRQVSIAPPKAQAKPKAKPKTKAKPKPKGK